MKYADKLKSFVGSKGIFSFSEGVAVFHIKQNDPLYDDTITEIGDDYVIVKTSKTRTFSTYVAPLGILVLIID